MNNTLRQLPDIPHDDSVRKLSAFLSSISFDRIFIVTDNHLAPHINIYIETARKFAPTRLITIPAGEANKNLSTLSAICRALSNANATRHSIIINIGGGMVSDIGGFAAAIFKRGIRYINIATTLLAAVDAAIGGKTSIDTSPDPHGNILKNELGAFHKPISIIIADTLFSLLPPQELLSGYGELVKTTMLLSTEAYHNALQMQSVLENPRLMKSLSLKCARFKKEITEQDPKEQGLRRILNLGHTAGHAFESILIANGTPFPHGICIAHGLLVTLILSHMYLQLDSGEIYKYRDFLNANFPQLPLSCPDMDKAESLMLHDKKNKAGESPAFVLLREVGDPVERFTPGERDIAAALDIYCDMTS